MVDKKIESFILGAVSISIIYFFIIKKYYNNVGFIKQTILNQALPENFVNLIKNKE